MSWKKASVSMPMSSAGILSAGSGEVLAGIKIEPRVIIIVTLIFVAIIKVMHVIYRV